MFIPRLTLTIIVVTAFLAGVALAVFWDRPNDFYTCMLHEMRGLPANMNLVAGKVCQARFGRPEAKAAPLD